MAFLRSIIFFGWVRKSASLSFETLFFLPLKNDVFKATLFYPFEWVIRPNSSFKTQFIFPSKNGVFKVRYIWVSFIFSAFCLSAAFFATSRIKTVRVGVRDCPQDNPLSKRARSFDLRQVWALFLYNVVRRLKFLSAANNPRICHFWYCSW